MERTIRIANTKTQQRHTIQTSATTLGELQDQMIAQGIDFSGMSFTEGITKTQLLSRDTQLPSNIMYKGQPTNDLVILLTNPNKQIASGAMDRKEAYRLVKEMKLMGAILEGEGQNYTRVKTDVLEQYIDINRRGADVLEETREELDNFGSKKEEKVNTPTPAVTAPHANTVDWFYDGIKAMVNDRLLYADDVVVLAELVTELAGRLKEAEPKVSDDVVDKMIADL